MKYRGGPDYRRLETIIDNAGHIRDTGSRQHSDCVILTIARDSWVKDTMPNLIDSDNIEYDNHW